MSISLSKPTDVSVNQKLGLVFLHTSLSILTTMLVAYLTANSGLLSYFLSSSLISWTVVLLPLPVLFAAMYIIPNTNKTIATIALHVFSASMGLGLGFLFARYTDVSIIRAFLGASALFFTMGVYGYFTKSDLSSMGKLLFIALIGIIITSVINIFLGSSTLTVALNVIAIIVFMGLTAYDVQTIKTDIEYGYHNNIEIRSAISLYLNFINLFTNLLQLTGDSD